MKLLQIYFFAILMAGTSVNGQDYSTKKERAQSKANMRQLSMALLMVSGDMKGDFPKEDFEAGLNTLDLVKKFCWNPRDAKRADAFKKGHKELTEKNCSYAYVGGGLKDSVENAGTMPIVWEKPCGDSWMIVAYADGNVKGFEASFKTNTNVVEVLSKKHGWSDSITKMYMKKAKLLDKAAKGGKKGRPVRRR